MLEPEDPGGTSLQVSHVVTIDASGMETEGSIIDTDCSENTKSVKRKRISARNQKKRRNHRPSGLSDCQLSPNDLKDNVITKALESDDKNTEIHHNEAAHSSNITSISCETERDDAVCILCSGSHFATDKKCPEYARQKAIKETMARNSISYSEASKVHPPVSKSDVVASASLAPSARTITYSSPYNSTSPSKSHTQSYRKTVFSKPKGRPRNTSKGYDQKAHAELIQDYSNIPSFSTGCLKNYKDLSEIITKDLIISIIQYLSRSNLIKIPSNDAASSKSFLTHGQSGPSTKPVSGDSMELPEY
ncbi:unnamed protein product [Parnassius mnemosyne]|uniref:Uncharacterized protein n=1 Tax=Parnassius mnemosyne TaxID=213953 RepID=A0AAV1LKP6_9NEOP